MSVALRMTGVVKRYGRGVRALDGLDLEVPTGALAGLVGPNGAGKTTAFSVVCGFLPPDEGRVDLLGEGPFDPWVHAGRVGVLPQDAQLPAQHTPRELLEHLARLQGLDAGPAARAAADTLGQVRLADRADDRVHTLSHGMRRRVSVATALVGAPELVLLDEPTAGLDPVQARGLREVLSALRGRTTVVVSSHNLLELEQICDWVVMVDAGRCVRQGPMAEVTGQRARLHATVAGPVPEPEALRQALAEHGVVLDGAKVEVFVDPDVDPDTASLALLNELVRQGVAVRTLGRGVSLEDRFVEDTRERDR